MFRYVERYWVRTVQVEHVSVVGRVRKTNNSSEAFNKVLLNKLKIWCKIKIQFSILRSVRYFDIISKILIFSMQIKEKLDQMIQRSFLEFNQIQQGLRVRRPMGNSYLANDVRIRDAQNGLQNGTHTIFHFLRIVAHSVDNLANHFQVADNILDDFIDDVEDIVPDPVPIEPAAFLPEPEIIEPAVRPHPDPIPEATEVQQRLPWSHVAIICSCGECSTALVQAGGNNLRCPVCRDNVEFILRTYR